VLGLRSSFITYLGITAALFIFSTSAADHQQPTQVTTEELARLRLLFRLSYEMRFVNLQSYEHGSKLLNPTPKA
jgi:hypothetical protein